jgi:hypothetical protein
VSRRTITLCKPLLCLDLPRDAYVLRAFGRRIGPVLREDRREQQVVEYAGPERRRRALAAGSEHRRIAA